MRAWLANAWEKTRSSLWFVPSVLVLAGAALAVLLTGLPPDEPGRHRPWLFRGSAEAARSLLAVVAGSLITVVAVAFSVTIIALQQASTRFTPRVLQMFTRARGNQVVLGTYIATFTYSLLVMREIRAPQAGDEGFVPALAVTGAVVLALVCLGLLVYFIDHSARSLEVSFIAGAIRRETARAQQTLFPETVGQPQPDPPAAADLLATLRLPGPARGTVVRARRSGYLRRIDTDLLIAATGIGDVFVWVPVRIGDFVLSGGELAHVYAERDVDETRCQRAAEAFVLDRERSLEQDSLFGVQQLVDIGLKALSPGINDPTTAEQALAQLGDIVAGVLSRPLPSSLRRVEGKGRYLFNTPDAADFVAESFDQLRRAAARDVHVTLYFLATLRALASLAPDERRAAPLRAQVSEVLAALPASGLGDTDVVAIRRRAEEVLEALTPGRGRSRRLRAPSAG